MQLDNRTIFMLYFVVVKEMIMQKLYAITILMTSKSPMENIQRLQDITLEHGEGELDERGRRYWWVEDVHAVSERATS